MFDPDTPAMPESTMPTFDPARAGPPRFLLCAECSTRIAHTGNLVSRAYRGHAGKAALFTTAKNITLDPPSILLMDSGAYTIQEFICKSCESYLGWKFARAHDGSERWKEGHYILELDMVQEQDGGEEDRYVDGQQSPLSRIDEEEPHVPTHRRLPSASAPPPKGAQQGRRSIQAAPRRANVPRRLELEDYEGGGGGPFWKPR